MVASFACKPDQCPQTNEQWEELLRKSSKQKIAYATVDSTALSIMFDESNADTSKILPIEKKISADQVKTGFKGDVTTSDTVVDELALMVIHSEGGSEVQYSNEWNIVSAGIVESSNKLLGNNVNIGMSKRDFMLMYFNEYDECFDNIQSVAFPYGMNFNEIKYIFDNDQLEKIIMTKFPD